MRYTPIYLLAVIFLISCGSDNSENHLMSSTHEGPSPNNDTFNSVEQDKIIGDLQFGMNKIETEKGIEEFNNKNLHEYGARQIGNFVYSDITAKYDENHLYSIKILGETIYRNEDYKVNEQQQEIRRIIEQKYGEVHDSTHVYEFVWNIGRKKIEIGAEGEWRASEYILRVVRVQVYVEIFLADVAEKVKLSNEKKEQQRKDSITNKAKNVF